MSGKRVLFVDDDHAISEMYISGLKSFGYTVDLCDNADDAVAEFTKVPFGYDVVVLDLSMLPGTVFKAEQTLGGLGTGVRLYEILRKSSPTVPVAVLTNVLQGPILKQLPVGTDNYLILLHKIDTDPFELPEKLFAIS